MELLQFLEENDLEAFKENLDMDSVEETDENGNTIYIIVLKMEHMIL